MKVLIILKVQEAQPLEAKLEVPPVKVVMVQELVPLVKVTMVLGLVSINPPHWIMRGGAVTGAG